MKVIIVIRRSPVQRFLVELRPSKLIQEVARLAARGKNSQAIAAALTKGCFEGEVSDSELSKVRADLILTEENANWDLLK